MAEVDIPEDGIRRFTRKSLEANQGPWWLDYTLNGLWLRLPVPEFGPPRHDLNLEFVHWHAREIRRFLRLTLPPLWQPFDDRSGMELTKLVNSRYVPGPAGWISESLGDVVVARARDLIREIQVSEAIPLRGEPIQVYLVALYTRVGCIAMAKATRVESVSLAGGTVPLDDNRRRVEYLSLVKPRWEAEDLEGNSWFRFGVTVAKAFMEADVERGGKPPVDAWLKAEFPDSPYWCWCTSR